MLQTIQPEMMLKVLGTLNEAQARWFVAREAMLLGRGGIAEMCRLTGVSKPTVIKGMKELKARPELGMGERIRRPGAGRKKLEDRNPGIGAALQAIMDETTAGDPMSLLKWTSKSTY